VDAPVIGAIITASVALVVAVGGAVRSMVSAAVDRRYERRRAFLIQAQDAMLVLREALYAYGHALQDDVQHGPAARSAEQSDDAGRGAMLVSPDAATGTTSFALAVPAAVDLRVSTARGRLTVAQSRLEDDAVNSAISTWTALAGASMIDTTDSQAGAELAAFEHVNDLIRSALRTQNAMSRPDRAGPHRLR
jgi:hypothetical protein